MTRVHEFVNGVVKIHEDDGTFNRFVPVRFAPGQIIDCDGPVDGWKSYRIHHAATLPSDLAADGMQTVYLRQRGSVRRGRCQTESMLETTS